MSRASRSRSTSAVTPHGDTHLAAKGAPASAERTTGGQFKKGTSGNPNGRPPKPKEHLHEVVLRVLYEPLPVGGSGQQGSMIAFEALIRSAIGHAIKDPRLGIALIKAFLATSSLPKVAEVQDDDEEDAVVLANFRRRELGRLGIEQVCADDPADGSGPENADGFDDDQERSP